MKNEKGFATFALIIIFLIFSSLGLFLIYLKMKDDAVISLPTQATILNKEILAEVTYLVGDAWTLVDGRKIEVKENDILKVGSIITTNIGARVILTFDDGSVVRLDEDSTLHLKELSSAKMLLGDFKGHVFSRVMKDAFHKFIIQTDTVTIESLGTTFSVENRETVNVKVFESKVKIKELDEDYKEVLTNEEWMSASKVIKNIEKSEIEKDKFLEWSLNETKHVTSGLDKNSEEAKIIVINKEEKKVSLTKEEVNDKPVIKLAGKVNSEGIFLNWYISNLDVKNGFKIVKSLESSPTYPSDGYVYVADSSVRNYKLDLTDGEKWHIRVCNFTTENKCDSYSNEVILTAEVTNEEDGDAYDGVSKINLKIAAKGDNKVKLEWGVEGKSEKGYKIVWSKNSDPTYPLGDGDKYIYKEDSGARSGTVSDLDSGEKYYFRVCEYLGGKCGKYSNEVSTTF